MRLPRFLTRLMAPSPVRVSGRPTSSNRASSMHLFWDVGPSPARAVTVDVEVIQPPATDALHFWALQVSFADHSGRELGAGHFGLQHHPRHHPGGAVNWGGYARDGSGELPGSVSSLHSTSGNVNTRDYRWHPGRSYRYRIEPSPDRGWRGSVTDLDTGSTTVVRDLWCGGDLLVRPMVWSEVFAPCEGPTAAVCWSRPRLEHVDGSVSAPTTATVNYQGVDAGGCTNTTAAADPAGLIQRTATGRLVPQGARLSWP